MTKFGDYYEGSANARLADAHGLGGGRLPPRQKRRNETQELTRPIEAALNAIPGVWAARNDVKKVPVVFDDRIKRRMQFGLGIGSADIICGVSLRLRHCVLDEHGQVQTITDWLGCQLVGLEVKPPGGTTHHDLSPEQEQWRRKMRSLGAVVETVHSVDEAVAVVDRIRSGT